MPRVRHTQHQPTPGFGYITQADSNLSRHAALSALTGAPFLYAMRVPGGFIKIGFTANLAMRVRQLHAELLGLTPGDLATEREVHEALRAHRHHGREWYHPTAEVLSLVNGWRDSFGLPHLAA